MRPIFTDSSWTIEQVHRAALEIEKIGREEMGLDPYRGQIEIVSSDQMLDAYATHGLPVMYPHWSFGKSYVQNQRPYEQGKSSLAYELIINSDPAIAYCMEENTSTMQALVIAHACIGHSHVYKNNYLFRDYTDAASLVDYLDFAKRFILKCEDLYGVARVEEVLDAAHALMWQSMPPPRNKRLSLANEQKRLAERQRQRQADYREIWDTVPSKDARAEPQWIERLNPGLPEHNLLYFLEKYSPVLLDWEKEIVRIVRKLAQYFYPSVQCSVLHESAAVYTHMFCLKRLHDKGLITDGAMLEGIHSTAHVIYQSSFERWHGWNIYTLGYAIAQDIERICTEPTEEDMRWFPDFAGCNDVMGTLRYAWNEFRDESFIRQFLSPKVIRDQKMFRLRDDYTEFFYEVDAIHDDDGYRTIRSSLADEYLPERKFPDIQVSAANLDTDRMLTLTHYTDPGFPLAEMDKRKTMAYLKRLWGFPVRIREVTRDGEYTVKWMYVEGEE